VTRGLHAALGVISLAIASVALFLPAYEYTVEYTQEQDFYRGYECLLIGWFPVLAGVTFAWLANLPWAWCAFEMLRGKSANALAAIVAVVIALTALTPFDAMRVDDAAWSDAAPRVGAYVWVSAIAVPILSVLAGLIRRHPSQAR